MTADPARDHGTDPEPARRPLALTVLPVVLVVLAVAPIVVRFGALPDPLATHWAFDGVPNGSMPRWAFTAMVVVTSVGLAVAIEVMARRPHPTAFEIAPAIGICAGVAALVAALSFVTVRANGGATVWTAASSIGPLEVLVPVVLGAIVGAWAFRVATTMEVDPPFDPVTAALPTVGLPPGGQAQWVGRCRARWAGPLVVGAGTIALVLVVAGQSSGGGTAWFVAAVFAIVALACAPFIAIRVTADRRGLRVEYGPLGWPVSTVALADIAAAHVEPDVVPMRWGGWGYRGSRRLLRGAAVVLRRGPGIRLELRSGSMFLVTVDDPATGAGLLNDLAGVTPTDGSG